MGEEWNDMANEHWHGVPEGTFNLLPRAGDIVVMSECLSRKCSSSVCVSACKASEVLAAAQMACCRGVRRTRADIASACATSAARAA